MATEIKPKVDLTADQELACKYIEETIVFLGNPDIDISGTQKYFLERLKILGRLIEAGGLEDIAPVVIKAFADRQRRIESQDRWSD